MAARRRKTLVVCRVCHEDIHWWLGFERYADDAVVHCSSRGQAERVLAAIAERMGEVGLELHADKTRIVYCKDGKRRGSYEHTSFTFLGFTFRPRGARTRTGELFLSFAPAVSKDALKKMGATVRDWKLHQRSGLSEQDLARWINPVVRGWMQYYGAFSRSPGGGPRRSRACA
ncbi:group II intron maturase-specific domain-containing protein [Streptomyces violascens]|uniref:group II intron maturase-specific domain-containing protein n=1 Tax=Streptomyces violascens TaxID=67381 RepID=UPI0036B6A6E0